jgi:hypothetical protein
MRHQSAAALWSSGSGPFGRARRTMLGASMPARPRAARRSASSGVNGSLRGWVSTRSKTWPHSARAGVRLPGQARGQAGLPAVGCLADLGGSGRSAVCRVDVGRGPPDRDVDEEFGGWAALALPRPGGQFAEVRPARRLGRAGHVPGLRGRRGRGPTRGRRRGPRGPRAATAGAGAGAAQPGVVQAPVQDGGDVASGVDLAHRGRGVQLLDGVEAVRCEQDEVSAQGGPGVSAGEVGNDRVGCLGRGVGPARAQVLLGGDVEGVDVPGGRVTQQEAGSSASRRRVLADREESSRLRIRCSRSVAVSGWVWSGRITLCSSPSPTTSRYRWLACGRG